MNSIDALSQHLAPAAMVVARVSGLAVQGPVLSSPAIPVRIKALLVLAIGLAVYPTVAANASLPGQAPLAMLAPLVALEFGIGVFIGFMASMPLLAAQFGGLSMGQQIGLGFDVRGLPDQSFGFGNRIYQGLRVHGPPRFNTGRAPDL
jgi:flagellar biosynthetic protein FliR